MGGLSDPTEALIAAVRRLLRADAALAELVGARIHDRHPSDFTPDERRNAFPYVEIGDVQCVDTGSSGSEGDVEAYLTVRCWSRPVRDGIPVGKTLPAQIASAVKAAVHTRENDLFTTPEFACSALHVESIVTQTDPDGVTAQSIVTIRALIQPR